MALLGQQLHEYKLLAPLGSGGMADVYLAKDTNLQRAVALKVVKEALLGDPRIEEGLLREALITAQIDDLNVAKVFRSGDWKTQPFYVMELLTGGSLAEVIEQRMSFTMHQYLSLFGQACAALHATVLAGVVHRDVKPGNFMLDPSGRLKLTDFGLAKMKGDDAGRTSWLLGTPLYIAPEIVQGEGGAMASDLYSLGASFFHLFVGRPPYVSDGRPFGVVEQHRHAAVPNLREFAKKAPGALRDLLADMMAKDPRERPRSFLEAGNRVKAIASGMRGARLEDRLRWCTVDNAMTPANGDRCLLCKNRYTTSVTARRLFDVLIVGWRSEASPDRVAEYMARAVGQDAAVVRAQIVKLPFRVGEAVTAEVAGRLEPLFLELGGKVEVVAAATAASDAPPGTRTLEAPPLWPPMLSDAGSPGRTGFLAAFG